MFKTLSKFLIPAVGGGGGICLTMHLTNTSGGLFNSLKLLNIKDKPDINESEIIPKEDQVPPESQKSDQSSDDSTHQSDSSDSAPSQPSADSQPSAQAASTPSGSDSSGNASPEDVIRDCAQIIQNKTSLWTDISSAKSLESIYQMTSTLGRMMSAIQQQQTNPSPST